jgi:microcystin degradation protein MlrC
LRDDFRFPLEKVDSIPAMIEKKHPGPIVLNELSDCTFGGSSGDAVATARFCAEHSITKTIAVGIVDPVAVSQAFTARKGSSIWLSVGGKVCRNGNPAIEGEMTLVGLYQDVCPQSSMTMETGMLFKRVALVEYQGVYLALIEYPGQIGGPAFLSAIGLDPMDFNCIIVKEGLNPFVTYDGIASRIVMIESPGFNPQQLNPGMFKHIAKGVYPIFPMEADAYVPRRYI